VAAAKLIVIVAAAVFAACSALAFEESEKRVQISIFDLVKARPRAIAREARLERAYVEKVIVVLKSHQTDVLACLKGDETLTSTFEISIVASGSAQVTTGSAGDAIAACVSEALRKIEYPRHSWRDAVEIEAPLRLERRTL